MRVRRILWLALLGLPLILGAPGAAAQGPAGVDGRITDGAGLPIRAATVSVFSVEGDVPIRMTESDELGYFRVLPLGAGRYRVRAVRIGHLPAEAEVEVREGERARADLTLPLSALLLEGISVTGERSRARARFEDDPGITSRELTVEELRLLPGLAETDPLRAIEILPGVISPSDFSAAFNVRGGSSDQNLILLDGFPLFNPFHLGGIFSVFNADMVDRVELQSGGFPAEFGGRVSSVLRVESDPGPGSLTVEGGVSLLATRVAVSGGVPESWRDPFGLRAVRWRVSGRRSYVDQLLRSAFEIPYHITDVQALGELWTAGGSLLSLTAYRGEDVLDLARISADDFPLRIYWKWGNELVGVRWSHGFEGGGRAELRAGVSRFATKLSFADFDDSQFRSRIEQRTFSGVAERWLGVQWKGKAGFSADRYQYANRAETGGTVFAAGASNGWSLGSFAQLEWRIPGSWLADLGLRFEEWRPDVGAVLPSLSPRLAVKRFFGGGEWAVKGSLGRYSQVVHSIRDEEVPLGIDIWILAGERAPQVVSDQIQIGVEGFLGEDWFVAVDAFHRSFDGVVTNNLAENPNDPTDDFAAGEGRGRGGDLFLERRGEGLTGSLSLSWLRAERTFPDFLSGSEEPEAVTYPPVFDRRLDLDLVLRWPLGSGWDVGARWHIGTGTPFTRPIGSYSYFSPSQTRGGVFRWQGITPDPADPDADEGDQAYAVLLGPRNGERLPTYHRLDLSLRRTLTPSWGDMTIYLDILNVYNQTNVLFYFYDYTGSPPTRSGLSMFPVLPTFGVEMRF